MMRRAKTLCFDLPGKQNTDESLKAALDRAIELGIENILVAPTTGETGVKACEFFKGFIVVVVTHHVGFDKPGVS